MAIYRGAGGPGDATTDAANEASIAVNKAAEAAASAAAAALSATAAASSATAAASSATNSASSATSSASSASAAATSATAAAGSATSAGTALSSTLTAQAAAELAQTGAETAQGLAEDAQAAAEVAQAAAETAQTAAETAQTGAETAETGAIAAKDAALAALANFDDRYFGAFVDNAAVATYATANGYTIDSGDLYFNTTTDAMQVYDGTQWLAAYVSGSGVLQVVNNLSDLDNVATARTNLGLGTAATTASTDYATAAQGALADSAIQAADLGTAAYTASTDYATAAQGSTADSAVQPGDLATVATSGLYSDLSGVPTNVSEFTNDSGYLTSFTETDPVYLASSWYTTTNNAANWDTAYGWGDHSTMNYAVYPSQTGNSGKFLTTDGTNTSWATVDADPAGTAVALAIALG